MGKASFTPGFYPYKKGGRKVLAMLKGEGGGSKSSGVILTQVFKVLAMIEGGGSQSYQPLKGGGGGQKHFYPILRGGDANSFRHFPNVFIAFPPPPAGNE